MHTKMSTRALALLALASVASAQGIVNGQRTVLGRLSASGPDSAVDFTAAGTTSPVKTGTLVARPVNCSQGEMYFATDATAGQNLYLCTTPGTLGIWTLQGGSGGSSISQTPCNLASSLGFQLNGTDETALLNATFASFYAAHGGCLAIDANKTLRADGQIKLPDSGSPNWTSPSYRITGIGPGVGGNGDASTVQGGSVLDLRYHGNSIYNGGPKLWANGMGTLELDHITIADMGTDCATFLLTTGTRLTIHDATFYSAVAEGSACNDAIVLGGTGNWPRTGAISDPFAGFGSVIERNSFLRMARVAVFQGNVNDIKFENNYVWGGNTTTPGPIIESVPGGAGTNFSNTIRGNTFEACNRVNGTGSCLLSQNCGLKLSAAQEWTIDSNGFYDAFSSSAAFLCGSSTAIRNNVTRTNYMDSTVSHLVDSNWDENNYMPWRSVPFFFDGGGSPLTGTTTRCTLVPFGGIINRFSMLADQSGSAKVSVKAVPMSSYAGPSSASDVSNGGEDLINAVAKQDSTLTGWWYTNVSGTATMTPNTVLCFTLSNASTITWLSGNVQIWEGR
jgi:hypothetical protein